MKFVFARDVWVINNLFIASFKRFELKSSSKMLYDPITCIYNYRSFDYTGDYV